MIVVLTGVSGAGKTTVGRRLADALGWELHDADDLHPPANVAKMRAAEPLTDADRAPWLARVNGYLRDLAAAGRDAVLACSALKRDYRRRILDGVPDARLVHLRADPATVAGRLAARRGHFMPPSLLGSQFATLEEPEPGEPAVVVDARGEPDAVVAAIRRALGV